MKQPLKPSAEDKAQAERFRDAARELEADESEQRFQDALRKIAKHKPKERDSEDD